MAKAQVKLLNDDTWHPMDYSWDGPQVITVDGPETTIKYYGASVEVKFEDSSTRTGMGGHGRITF
jgi:hypothetical protein